MPNDVDDAGMSIYHHHFVVIVAVIHHHRHHHHFLLPIAINIASPVSILSAY